MRMVSAALPIGRRALLAGTGAGLLSMLYPPRLRAETAAERSPQFLDAYKRIAGERTPEDSGISLDLPEIAENGNNVPYKVAVDSPMSEADHVTKLHLLSTANPNAVVATFHFTLHSGKAAVGGRMRLAKTQDVVAIAETSTGRLLVATRLVGVTIGGCGI